MLYFARRSFALAWTVLSSKKCSGCFSFILPIFCISVEIPMLDLGVVRMILDIYAIAQWLLLHRYGHLRQMAT